MSKFRRCLLVSITLLGFGCATSPTGRKQLILMPEGQMASLGVQAFDQMKAQTPVEQDLKTRAYVLCVTDPIVRALKGKTSVEKWEVVVFKEESANAFALPGGKIGVHTGLLKVAQTDAQLAAVIGHEVGHVIAKHGNERVSEGVLAQAGMVAASVISKDNPNSNLIMAALGLGAQVGIMLPHGRTQESEADEIGLNLMADAGFDPRQSVELWKNMMAESKGAPPEFLSTHPASQTRIDNLNSKMAPALAAYQKSQSAGNRPSCAR
jgi:predicted Zn-dependent protease